MYISRELHTLQAVVQKLLRPKTTTICCKIFQNLRLSTINGSSQSCRRHCSFGESAAASGQTHPSTRSLSTRIIQRAKKSLHDGELDLFREIAVLDPLRRVVPTDVAHLVVMVEVVVVTTTTTSMALVVARAGRGLGRVRGRPHGLGASGGGLGLLLDFDVLLLRRQVGREGLQDAGRVLEVVRDRLLGVVNAGVERARRLLRRLVRPQPDLALARLRRPDLRDVPPQLRSVPDAFEAALGAHTRIRVIITTTTTDTTTVVVAVVMMQQHRRGLVVMGA